MVSMEGDERLSMAQSDDAILTLDEFLEVVARLFELDPGVFGADSDLFADLAFDSLSVFERRAAAISARSTSSPACWRHLTSSCGPRRRAGRR